MIAYEVALEVDLDLEDQIVEYFEHTHLPEMHATGCFVRISFEHLEPGRWRSRYECDSQAELDRYLADHADAMRADFARHFPVGATPSRQVWEITRTWGPDATDGAHRG